MIVAAFVLIALALGLVAAVVRSARPRSTPIRPPARPPTRRPIRADVPHLLYVYRRRNGTRIYGGISNEPPARHARHLIDQDDRWWMVQTDGVMYPVRWYGNRDDARIAERALVREMYYADEEPANYHHNPGRRRVAR
jgi:predicted GIY-YIG superfamily endonuclease